MKHCKFLLAFILILCINGIAVAANIPTISVDELHPGMKVRKYEQVVRCNEIFQFNRMGAQT